MTTNYCISYCTVPDFATAENLSKIIIESELAACVNISAGITAFYKWKGELKQGNELLMIIKTHKDKLQSLEQKVVELHPYEFPEFITVPIIQGNKDYLDWVSSVVGK